MTDIDDVWPRIEQHARAQRELRELLNEWDPIGVFDLADVDQGSWPVDEYDCIREPLIPDPPTVISGGSLRRF